MSASPRIVLHIGTEKTGTTTIQTFFARNRDTFHAAYVLYPHSPGSPNHLKLSAFADPNHTRGDILPGLGVTDIDSLETFRSEFRRNFYSEIHASPAKTLVLSNEHCHSRFRTLEEISRLRELLLKISNDIRVIVYFRRQDRVAVSFYSSQLKFGGIRRHIFPPVGNELPYYYDFYSVFRNWVDVFGKENIVARRFDDKYFVDGSLVRDFVDAAGLVWSDDFEVPFPQNLSLNLKAQAFLSRLNDYVPLSIENKLNRSRTGLIEIFERNFSGSGETSTKQEARTFYAHFVESNKNLEKELGFDDTQPLFDDDFSEYSDEKELVHPDYNDAVSIAGVLWNEKSRETNHLRAENFYLKACLAVGQGKAAQAIEHLEKALSFNPSYPEAALLLADHLLKASSPDKALACLRSALEMNPGRQDLDDRIRAIEEGLAH